MHTPRILPHDRCVVPQCSLLCIKFCPDFCIFLLVSSSCKHRFCSRFSFVRALFGDVLRPFVRLTGLLVCGCPLKGPMVGGVTDRERPLEPGSESSPAETGPAQLSRLLWQARESLEIWADTVEARSRQPDGYTRGLVAEIDTYRAQRGWSRSGYGGEWLCPWCGDHFGSRDDDVPPVCDLCRRAGRGVPAQDALESGDPGSGGSTDGRLEPPGASSRGPTGP